LGGTADLTVINEADVITYNTTIDSFQLTKIEIAWQMGMQIFLGENFAANQISRTRDGAFWSEIFVPATWILQSLRSVGYNRTPMNR